MALRRYIYRLANQYIKNRTFCPSENMFTILDNLLLQLYDVPCKVMIAIRNDSVCANVQV